ncbi:MAG TPA: OmpH family outer membrane protein [Bacteroidales bacterium]|jgi:outer membrane protein|nr:OmpH family outer membrane protein [Bacteroidales bacterium]MDI9573272.1 OmpH family outer membrane protein [Bacteroidota bacterium]OQC59289.1 MAG: Outer membrane protein (OmpH-like) [Bacteroidetes bacterium ADurb.Bin012]MBP9511286.1 OmpH family outer membrane protein [Bacteroidales bacterium]MBP9588977.1 OmpH family outer membrane protein [Bacteroidales bacterium]
MIRKRLALLFTAIMLAIGVSAQKFAYVDSEYILQNIPEYNDALAQIDEFAAQWQQELEAKFAAIDKMYKDYQAEAVLLPEEMKRKREDEIMKAEKAAKDLQKQRFGKDGDLFKKRQELVKPIQDKIYSAIERIAQAKNYAMIFDKAGNVTVMYADAKYDISDEVLEEMGYGFNTRKNK